MTFFSSFFGSNQPSKSPDAALCARRCLYKTVKSATTGIEIKTPAIPATCSPARTERITANGCR